ncbi:hypothetical protein PC39_11232 [Salinisphaera sp. PC39]
MLIPVALATGAFDDREAMLLIAYSSGEVVHCGKKTYMTVESALDWNRNELQFSSGVEKEYRSLLVRQLEAAVYSGEFQYSDELIEKWALAFPHHAKSLLKSQSKKIDPALKELIRNAK